MSLPDFNDTLLFPRLNSIPIPDLSHTSIAEDGTFSPPEVLQASDPTPRHYLLAEIKYNMTITKPTLVCFDRDDNHFAVTFNSRVVDFKAKGLKKGNTVVVPNARLIPPKTEGGKSSVQVFEGEEAFVRMLPGGLGTVLGLGLGESVGGGVCGCCGKGEGEGEGENGVKLNRCTGCATVRYCGKECQGKGWEEGGHKRSCKVLKAVRGIWPAE